MPIETDVDRAAFVADFGVSVTWTPAGGSPVTLTANYDSPTSDEGGGSSWQSAAVQQQRPQITVRSVDVPAKGARGDAIAVSGIAFPLLVRGIYPDGTGMARVELERAPGP